jgi:hypothetical protein
MPLDTRIALSIEPLQVPFRDPIASYNQLAQLTSADTQNRLAQMQMQEHEQMAPYRMQEAQTRAASAKLTYDQAKQAQDFITSVMAKAAEHPESPQDPIEAAQQMLMHPNPQVQAVGGHMLDAAQKLMTYKQQQAWLKDQPLTAETTPVNASAAPMVASSAKAAPSMFVTKDSAGRDRYIVNEVEVSPEEYQSAKSGVVVNPVSFSGQQTKVIQPPNNALAPAVSAEPVVNALAAPTALAPAKASADSVMAQIAAGDRKYGEAKGWLSQRALLVDQAKELLKNPVMHVVANNLVGPDGKVVYEGTPDMHFQEVVNKDGTTTTLAVNKKTGVGTPVTVNGVPVAGVNPTMADAVSRLAFDREKFTWEKANPGKEIKEVVQNGVTKYFAIDKRTGESTPVTIAGGKILSGTDTATQRLAFDQAKFAWEKANPGFTIQQTEDGSIVGVNNRTLQAYPVTLNAGTPPSAAPFTGVGGAAPSAGVGRGVVGVTDNRVMSGAPAVAPAGVPLKGKGSQPTEGERKSATLLQRLQFSQSQLTDALADDPNAAKPGVFASAIAKLSTPLANTLTPEARQRVQAAQLDMLDAALTLGTGAAYTKEQLEGYRESYFPQIGDKPNQILDKQKRLENIISAAKIAAGRAAQLVPAAPAPAVGGEWKVIK